MAKSGPAHPEVKRLLRALRERRLISGPNEATELAALLNVSPQSVSNWKQRGLSKEIKLEIQTRFGISATWLSAGDDDRAAEPPQAPLQTQEPVPALDYIPTSARSQREKRLAALVEQLDDTALAILVDKASDLLKDYARAQAKAS